MIDCSKCAPYMIRNKTNIIDFSKTLVKQIDMISHGEPQVIHFGSGNKGGFTLVQLIETSNIIAHFCEESDDMYLDVFSCKIYQPSVVFGLVNTYFQPQIINQKFVTRRADLENEMTWKKPLELK